MRYRKLGLVYCPDGSNPLLRRYAIVPTPMVMPDRVRVFFTSTDEDYVGRVFFLDLDRRDPTRVLAHSKGPVLDAGLPGAFDVHGVNPLSLVNERDALRLYYIGYRRFEPPLPYQLLAGVAESRDGGLTFNRVQAEPILPPTADEPNIRSAINVHRNPNGWRGWYVGGGTDWIERDGKKQPVYGLRHTTSDDGIHWRAPTIVLEPDRSTDQIGFGRPWIMRDGDSFRMFISVRTVGGYSISHATSPDGLAWTNWQHDIIPRSESGWDSEMCCYACAIALNGSEFVFYNGNRNGQTGFGLAIREN